ncbi:hypothetical protein [Spirochaeta cellobiosiphila]|uniref:hypothetical protein n=1 Tax=Spirochaeta cellobiosiphila TaxID=504483 RepID=UPI00040C8C97|nr:hypothetical protein [Spirochaeta cellobiosiphila]
MALIELNDSDCLEAIETHNFSDELLSKTNKTIIVLTQSWCPQWVYMKNQLMEIDEENSDITIYYIEYDLKDYYQQFMSFKEEHYNNHHVPFVLYYLDSQLINTSNFTYKDGILNLIKQTT